MIKIRAALAVCLLVFLVSLSACGGGSKPITTSISSSVASTTVASGSSAVTLTAAVSNDSKNGGVSWTLSPATGCGSLASSQTSATYTPAAAATLNSDCTATITATSATDTSKTATLALTIKAITVSVTSGSGSTTTLGSGAAPVTLTATLNNEAAGATDTVTWTSNGGCGTLGSSGNTATYTPPTSLAANCTETITAASTINSHQTSVKTFTINEIAVAITAPTVPVTEFADQGPVSLAASITNDGAGAGVNWTLSPASGCGSIVASGTSATYAPPAAPAAQCAVTATATSKTDPTKSASTAAITINPIVAVAFSPAAPTSVAEGATQALSAAITNDLGGKGLNWALSPAGCGSLSATSGTTVNYIAPSALAATCTAAVTVSSVADSTKTAKANIGVNLTSVSITSPTSAQNIGASSNVPFTAAISNDGSGKGISWSLTPATGCGSLSSASGTSTNYAAPAESALASACTATVSASSTADSGKSASIQVTAYPISVSAITSGGGATPANILASAPLPLPLAATLSWDIVNGGLSASITSGNGCGSLSVVTSSDNKTFQTSFTPLSSVSSSCAATITFASVTDTTRTSSVTINVIPTLAISTTTVPNGKVGVAYSQQLSSTGGSGNVAWSVTPGSLPNGLSLSGSGLLSGSPTAVGNSTFTVQAKDSGNPQQTVFQVLSVTIDPATLVITTTTAPAAALTQPYSYQLAYTGGTPTVTWTLTGGSLPAGFNLSGGGLISGTTSTPGTSTFTVQAADSGNPQQIVSQQLSIVASAQPLVISTTALPNGVQGQSYSQQLVSTGGFGAINWSITGSLPAGVSLNGNTISGTPSVFGSFAITVQAQDSTTPTPQTVTKPLTLVINQTLAINTSSLPDGTTGINYQQSLSASGGVVNYTWSLANGSQLPAGLNLAGNTISGTPSAQGLVNFTVQVQDSGTPSQIVPKALSINIAAQPLVITTTTLPPASTSQNYNQQLSFTGGSQPITWTLTAGSGPLPPGLTLSTSGLISGTATGGTAPYQFTVQAVDSGSPVQTKTAALTINVSAGYSVSGQINSVNCCNMAMEGVTVTINTTPNPTTTLTDNNGNFSFQNLPNGTYTVTPSMTGASFVSLPASLQATVSDNSVNNLTFSAAVGYTVSGTVDFPSGTKTGQVYLTVQSTSGNNNGWTQGTSITWPTASTFIIHGVPSGTYTVQAWLDNLGTGARNASNPTGSSSSFTVNNANVSAGADVALTDPGTITLGSAPKIQVVNPIHNGALVEYKAITNSNGVEMPTSYNLQWSTNGFTSIAGSKTFPANGTHINVWILNEANGLTGLTDGAVLSFRVQGVTGSSTSGWSSTYGPVTIGAPTGGNTVSGTVTFTGTATGPLYVGFLDQSLGKFYATSITSPVSPASYTVQVPNGTNYYFFGILDQNNDGMIDVGDISNTNGGGNTVTVISGPTNTEDLTLSSADSNAVVTTKHSQNAGAYDSYNLNFDVRGGVKMPVAVQLTNGPNVLNLMDIGQCSSCGDSQAQAWISIGNVRPMVGDTYTFTVTNSDGSVDILTPKVTTVLDAFATGLAPTTGTDTSTTPTFTWTDPLNASNYTYQFYLSDQSGTIWQIPGQNSKSGNGLSSSVTSLNWGVDPTDSSNTPSGNLSNQINYNWSIQVQDSTGNSAQTSVNYQP